jgi:putative addiction module CopG family antidote
VSFDLDPDVAGEIRRRVRSGEYPDAAAVVRAAIRMLDAADRSDGGVSRLKRLVQHGLDDLALARATSGDIVFAALKQRAKTMRDEA